MQSLVNGFQDEAPAVQKYLAGFTASLGAASSANLSVSTSGSGSGSGGVNGRAGGPQIIQNVYPTPGLSEQQVGIFAAHQLAWAMRGQMA